MNAKRFLQETIFDLHKGQVIKNAIDWASRMNKAARQAESITPRGVTRRHFKADGDAYLWLIENLKLIPSMRIMRAVLKDIAQAEKNGTSGALAKHALDVQGMEGW